MSTTESGIPVAEYYGPPETAPGRPPYTRGIHPSMYRGRSALGPGAGALSSEAVCLPSVGVASIASGASIKKEPVMGLVILLIVLALIFGGLGFFVAALKWTLIIAAVLFIAGLVLGWSRRST